MWEVGETQTNIWTFCPFPPYVKVLPTSMHPFLTKRNIFLPEYVSLRIKMEWRKRNSDLIPITPNWLEWSIGKDNFIFVLFLFVPKVSQIYPLKRNLTAMIHTLSHFPYAHGAHLFFTLASNQQHNKELAVKEKPRYLAMPEEEMVELADSFLEQVERLEEEYRSKQIPHIQGVCSPLPQG